MDTRKLLVGAVSGFLGAFLADLHAWSKTAEGSSFAWQTAIKRWIAGAVSGALTTAGLSGVS